MIDFCIVGCTFTFYISVFALIFQMETNFEGIFCLMRINQLICIAVFIPIYQLLKDNCVDEWQVEKWLSFSAINVFVVTLAHFV